MSLIRNPWFLGFAAVYTAAVTVLVTGGVYSPAEPLFILLIFGIAVPALAWGLSRRCRPLAVPVRAPGRELAWVLLCVVGVAAWLVWGKEVMDLALGDFAPEGSRARYAVRVIQKVVVFVLLPYLLFARLFGYRWRDYGLSARWREVFAPRYLALFAGMSLAYLAIQALVGQGARPVLQGEFALSSVLLGTALLYPLLVIEVGLVEEFFFRALVQTRLAAWLRSETAGILGMALVFGLAHAPGLYLRGAGGVTALGDAPTAWAAMAYSVAVLSLAGLAFGVLWARTRNLLILMLIHASIDLLPHLPEFILAFGL